MSYLEFLNSLTPKRREIAEKAVSLYLSDQASRYSTAYNSREVYSLMKPRIIGLEDEHVWLMYLNNALKVLGIEEISCGGMSTSMVDVRIILKKCLKTKSCTKFIMLHNHPSGDPKPSGPDDNATSKVRAAARTIGIELCDHCIVTEHGGIYSYAEHGW